MTISQSSPWDCWLDQPLPEGEFVVAQPVQTVLIDPVTALQEKNV